MESDKLVLFGAGKIGRSFIGPLFSRAGFEVVFIDADKRIIEALNESGRYSIVVKSEEKDEVLWADNVRGVLVTDTEKAVEEIASATILATAVGQNNLPKIAPVIAKGLMLRFERLGGRALDIILAENLRDAAGVFKQELRKYMPQMADPESYVGLIETSIGKMVPIMPKSVAEKDPLTIYAEPYNTLIIDKKAFKNPIPRVKGLAPKENMFAWVDRKLFIHNLGHAAAAYYGNLTYPNLVYMHEIMARADVYDVTRSVMLQAATVLKQYYPDEFSEQDLTDHINDLLHRFSNKALGDTVYRVGQDLYRKLGPEDRLIGALKLALAYNMPYDKILFIIICAVQFKAVDELGLRNENDVKFSKEAEKGISHILETVCGLQIKEFPDIHIKAKEIINNKASNTRFISIV